MLRCQCNLCPFVLLSQHYAQERKWQNLHHDTFIIYFLSPFSVDVPNGQTKSLYAKGSKFNSCYLQKGLEKSLPEKLENPCL